MNSLAITITCLFSFAFVHFSFGQSEEAILTALIDQLIQSDIVESAKVDGKIMILNTKVCKENEAIFNRYSEHLTFYNKMDLVKNISKTYIKIEKVNYKRQTMTIHVMDRKQKTGTTFRLK